jgi:nicotinamidase-related amidase
MGDIAIVTVDLQRAFFDPRLTDIGRVEKAICLPGVRELLALGRRNGWRIVHVVTEHETAATLPRYLQARGRQPYCTPGSPPAELMNGLLAPGDYTVVKHAFSGFGNTTLVTVLAGVPSVVLCGVAADCCILHTAFDGATTHAKDVYVPYQAVGASRVDTYVFALEAMAKSVAHIVDLDEIKRRETVLGVGAIVDAKRVETLRTWATSAIARVLALQQTHDDADALLAEL